MAKKTILIVDDEILLVDMITLRLEANGYDVIAAHDGFEGLAKAEQFHPDLIILDISMEGMDGYTMLKTLRQTEKIKGIPVIMLTASGKNKKLFEEEGISDFILKPFDTKSFLKKVDKIVKKGRKKK